MTFSRPLNYHLNHVCHRGQLELTLFIDLHYLCNYLVVQHTRNTLFSPVFVFTLANACSYQCACQCRDAFTRASQDMYTTGKYLFQHAKYPSSNLIKAVTETVSLQMTNHHIAYPVHTPDLIYHCRFI